MVYTIHPKPQFFTLSIANTGNQTAEFYVTPPTVNLFNNESILKSILQPGMSDKEKAIAVWKFICIYRYHCYPISQSSQKLHNPAELINAFGCGLCDDANSVLVNLATLAGMKARLIGLTGHVVAEIFFEEQWHFFDADGRVYFENGNGHIYSIHELASNKKLLQREGLPFLKRELLQSTICSEYDNHPDTFHQLIDSAYNSTIRLPSQAVMKFHSQPASFISHIIAYLNQDSMPHYRNSGNYIQEITLSGSAQVVKTESNYALIKGHIRSSFQKSPYRVYYSSDERNWRFVGQTSSGFSNLVFTPYDTTGEKFCMAYYLKFEPVLNKGESTRITIENEFMFSDRVLFNNPGNSFKIISLSDSAINRLDIQLKAK